MMPQYKLMIAFSSVMFATVYNAIGGGPSIRHVKAPLNKASSLVCLRAARNVRNPWVPPFVSYTLYIYILQRSQPPAPLRTCVVSQKA